MRSAVTDIVVGLLSVLAGYGLILGDTPDLGVATWTFAFVLGCALVAITGGGILICLGISEEREQ